MRVHLPFVLGLTSLVGASSSAMVHSPRVTSDRWPSGYSPNDFANNVVRIERARTDEEKCKALFAWNQRVESRGGYDPL